LQRQEGEWPKGQIGHEDSIGPFRSVAFKLAAFVDRIGISMSVEEQDQERRQYPRAPLVGVGAVAIKDGRILLIKRAFEPSKGKWSIPGGLVEIGERLTDACAREVEEETGIKIQVLELINAYDMIVPDEVGKIKHHYVLIDFLARPVGGTERSSVEVLEMKWVTYEEAKQMDMTNSARKALQELFGSTGP
jgi:ADP-ribose pyrophosphatase YjhB (NUDIX family)